MKKKLLLPIAIVLATILIVIPSVLGAFTLTSPVSEGNYTGSVTITATYLNLTDGINSPQPGHSNCSYSSGGAWTNFTDTMTINNNTLTLTHTITAADDSTTMSVFCLLKNATNALANTTGTATGVTYDTTKPSYTTTEFNKESIIVGEGFKYKIDTSDAGSGVHTTNKYCNVTDPESTITTATLDSGWVEVAGDRTIDKGTWTLSCVIADHAGNTQTASTTLKSRAMGAAAGGAVTVPSGFTIIEDIKNLLSGEDGMDTKTLLIIAAVIVGAVLLLGKKKR